MKTADAVAIRGTAALQMECEVFKAYSHTFFMYNRLWGRRGGRPARLQLKASNNKPGLSETKGRRGKGTRNEKQQKSFVYIRWTKSCKQSQCLAAVAEKIYQQSDKYHDSNQKDDGRNNCEYCMPLIMAATTTNLNRFINCMLQFVLQTYFSLVYWTAFPISNYIAYYLWSKFSKNICLQMFFKH